MTLTLPFAELRNTEQHRSRFGGKAAKLGEMREKYPVPDGFALDAAASVQYFKDTGLIYEIRKLLANHDIDDVMANEAVANKIQAKILAHPLPDYIVTAVTTAYHIFCSNPEVGPEPYVGVRSSAPTEDLDNASSAGQHESYLFVRGLQNILGAVHNCIASLFTARAIAYHMSQDHDFIDTGMAVVIIKMIEPKAAGVMMTVNGTTGNPDEISISVVRGLAELAVQGATTGDEYLYSRSRDEIVWTIRNTQDYLLTLVEGVSDSFRGSTGPVPVERELVGTRILTDDQIRELVDIGQSLHDEAGAATDIEWVLDQNNEFWLVQKRAQTALPLYIPDAEPLADEPAKLIGHAVAASPGVVVGKVVHIRSLKDCARVCPGDVMVAVETLPHYLPTMRKASAFVTETGGPNSHAAVIAKEQRKPCVAGMKDAMEILQEGETITVDGSHGDVFHGEANTRLAWWQIRLDAMDQLELELAGKPTKTKVLAIVSNGTDAAYAAPRSDGIGLARLELIIGSHNHPAWYIKHGREEKYVGNLTKGMLDICRHYKGKRKVIRTPDLRSNEYRKLRGGRQHEPTPDKDPNPMIGYRGPYRYMQEPHIFALDCEAMRRVIEVEDDVEYMIPFVRTVDELDWTINFMAEHGISRANGTKIGMMFELPKNILRFEDYVFYPSGELRIDFGSCGSNDLTQLTLGIDRDGGLLTEVADESDPAVQDLLEMLGLKAAKHGFPMSICGNGPSNHPWMVGKLVTWEYGSISLQPGDLVRGRKQLLDLNA